MKDEIKEIIELINTKYEDYYIDDFLSGEDVKKLVDYITNLQEENEELKAELQEEIDSATWWNNRYKAVERDYKNYKSRIDKAIEYINIIKKNTPNSTRKDDAKMILINYEVLLNILNGDDK